MYFLLLIALVAVYSVSLRLDERTLLSESSREHVPRSAANAFRVRHDSLRLKTKMSENGTLWSQQRPEHLPKMLKTKRFRDEARVEEHAAANNMHVIAN